MGMSMPLEQIASKQLHLGRLWLSNEATVLYNFFSVPLNLSGNNLECLSLSNLQFRQGHEHTHSRLPESSCTWIGSGYIMRQQCYITFFLCHLIYQEISQSVCPCQTYSFGKGMSIIIVDYQKVAALGQALAK